MNPVVLWRRLTPTDFRAMNGNASPYGRGGGAMHIALGVRSGTFPIDDFLNAPGKTEVTISAAADPKRAQIAPLSFSGNPRRRGGEWRISDQYSNRHPAWTSSLNFPIAYDPTDPPYILLFRIGSSFHARFALESQLSKLTPSERPKGILSSPTGIGTSPTRFAAAFFVPGLSRFEEFEIEQKGARGEAFDPTDATDGRKKIIAAVIRRLGQQAFRRKLISAYASCCAVTQCKSLWVLEAAHITPYRGIRTNSVNNGLLLRADVHTLYDLALISVEPNRRVVRVSRLLQGSEYEQFDGRALTLPSKTPLHPSVAALEYHYRLFHP